MSRTVHKPGSQNANRSGKTAMDYSLDNCRAMIQARYMRICGASPEKQFLNELVETLRRGRVDYVAYFLDMEARINKADGVHTPELWLEVARSYPPSISDEDSLPNPDALLPPTTQ